MRSFIFIATCATLVSFTIQSPCVGQPDSVDPRARVSSAGLAQTLSEFPYQRVTFRVTRSEATNLENARAGRTRNAESAKFRYIKSERYALLECEAAEPVPDGQVVIRHGSEGRAYASGSFAPEKILRTNDVELSFSPVLRAANLNRNEWRRSPIAAPLPLSFFGSLGSEGENAPHVILSRPDVCRFHSFEVQLVDGVRVDAIAYSSKLTGIGRRHFLDPMRGYLPCRSEYFASRESLDKQKWSHVTELISVRECTNGRWYPTHIRWIRVNPSTSSISMDDLEVIDLDVDTPPQNSDFAIELPSRTQIKAGPYAGDSEYSRTWYYLKQTERVQADDIEGMFMTLKLREADPLADTAVIHTQQANWHLWLLPGLGVALLIGLALYARRRFRPPTSTA